MVGREEEQVEEGGVGGDGEDVSLWIASEIFSIAKTQAAEIGVMRGERERWGNDKGQKGKIKKGKVEMEVGVGVEDYDESESLM